MTNDTDDTPQSRYAKLTNEQLISQLRELGLSVKGKKAELLARLEGSENWV